MYVLVKPSVNIYCHSSMNWINSSNYKFRCPFKVIYYFTKFKVINCENTKYVEKLEAKLTKKSCWFNLANCSTMIRSAAVWSVYNISIRNPTYRSRCFASTESLIRFNNIVGNFLVLIAMWCLCGSHTCWGFLSLIYWLIALQLVYCQVLLWSRYWPYWFLRLLVG